MGEDKETRKRLLESARKEFSENGYTKASLRKICANAGVTTGALYFFFKDKEDLFGAIVDPPFKGLIETLSEHFRQDIETVSSENWQLNDGDHDELAAALIHQLYANYNAFMLLLTKSQGSKFESCVDEIVDAIERTYQIIAEKIAQQLYNNKRVNTYMTHWLSHMSVDAFIHLLTHEPNEQTALKNMRQILNYIIKGCMEMILIPNE